MMTKCTRHSQSGRRLLVTEVVDRYCTSPIRCYVTHLYLDRTLLYEVLRGQMHIDQSRAQSNWSSISAKSANKLSTTIFNLMDYLSGCMLVLVLLDVTGALGASAQQFRLPRRCNSSQSKSPSEVPPSSPTLQRLQPRDKLLASHRNNIDYCPNASPRAFATRKSRVIPRETSYPGSTDPKLGDQTY